MAQIRSCCTYPCRAASARHTATCRGRMAVPGLSEVSQRRVYPEALIACSLNTRLRAPLASPHQISLAHDEPLTVPLLTSVTVL